MRRQDAMGFGSLTYKKMEDSLQEVKHLFVVKHRMIAKLHCRSQKLSDEALVRLQNTDASSVFQIPCQGQGSTRY